MDGHKPLAGMNSNVLLLYAARGIRGFGDGFAIIILPAYLSAIGMTPVQIGVIATAALLGTSLMTLAIGFVAPRFDMRNLLLAGAGLMVATGLAFPQAEHIAFILLVGFLGTINPSAGDAGVLVPLEHAMLAQNVADDERTREWAERLDGTFMGSFFGDPAEVAGRLHELANAGVSRVQVSPFSDASFELLAPHLGL